MANTIRGSTIRLKPEIRAAMLRRMASEGIRIENTAYNMAVAEWVKDFMEGDDDGRESASAGESVRP